MSDVEENKKVVSIEYLKKAAQDGYAIKKRSYELMDIRRDSQILDVGCGPATDTIALAEYIGDAGRVVGVDSDPEVVAAANLELTKRKVKKNVTHVLGNALSLPFASGEFDRVHAERLLQVLPKSTSIERVFSEMNRVLKPKGLMCLVDTDWGSASVNYSDSELERKFMNFFATKMRPNGFAGRQLLESMKKQGYVDVKVEVVPFVTRKFSETMFGDWLTNEALKHKAATKMHIAKWREELERKTTEGTFLSYVNIVMVAGCKV